MILEAGCFQVQGNNTLIERSNLALSANRLELVNVIIEGSLH